MDDKPTDHRPRRRWKLVALGCLGVLALLIFLLPQALNTNAGRRFLLSRANLALAPGRLEVARFRFSWFAPTRISGLVLRTPEGRPVAKCDEVAWDRSLFQILTRRPRFGSFLAPKARFDVIRRPDGSIDIVEVLRPILNGNRETDWTLEVVDGTLLIHDAGLAEPIQADAFQLTLRRPAAPEKISWDAVLSGADRRKLTINGAFDRWDDRADGKHGLVANARADRWPLAIRVGGATAKTELSGSVDASRSAGKWVLLGEIKTGPLGVSSPSLNAGTISLEESRTRWSVAELDSGWAVRSFNLRTPVGSLAASGTLPPTGAGRFDATGRLDLPSLLRRWPGGSPLKESLVLDRGVATLSLGATSEANGRIWMADVRLSDLSAHAGESAISLEAPIALSARAQETKDSFVVESASMDTSFLHIGAEGEIDVHGVEIKGHVDLAALQTQVGKWFDLGNFHIEGDGKIDGMILRDKEDLMLGVAAVVDDARIGKGPDPLGVEHLRLGVSVTQPRTDPAGWYWDARLSAQKASRTGLVVGPFALLVGRHGSRDPFRIDPIETTLNGGRLTIIPQYVNDVSPSIVLQTGTELVEAEVSEELTRNVLAYAAPILDGATRVSGRVSAKIDRAVFPLRRDSAKTSIVEGKVVFNDLLFTPGPLGDAVLTLLKRDRSPMRLDQPVVLAISDGIVHTKGLAVPISDLTAVQIEGDVGFDKTLDLVATIPFTPAMFPNGGLLGQVVSGTSIRVPIRGTLDDPKVDRDAFRAGMGATGKDLLQRGAILGASELLNRLTRPRDPNAPPPLTPRERRELRLERKMERRAGKNPL